MCRRREERGNCFGNANYVVKEERKPRWNGKIPHAMLCDDSAYDAASRRKLGVEFREYPASATRRLNTQ